MADFVLLEDFPTLSLKAGDRVSDDQHDVDLLVRQGIAIVPYDGDAQDATLALFRHSRRLRSDINLWSLLSARGIDGLSLTRTVRPLTIFVDARNGVDSNPGTSAAPLATIEAAERIIPMSVVHEVVVQVSPHPGAGYAWPTFRARFFSGADVGIWVVFPEINVIATDTVITAKNGVEWVTVTSLVDGAWDGKTIEMTSGAAINDRRTIRNNNNTTTDLVPVAEFSAPVVPGDTFRIIEPHAGNLIIPPGNDPMVQGTGISESGPFSSKVIDEGGWLPSVNIVNAIIVVGDDWTAVVDGRLALFGCEIFSAETFIRCHGSGQFLMGRHAWNTVIPPSTEPALTNSSWVGWGVHSTESGTWLAWWDSVPYVTGFVVCQGRYAAWGGTHHINGHLKGALQLLGYNNGTDVPLRTKVSFGKAAPFPVGPANNPGVISADLDGTLAAAYAGNGSWLVLHDETHLTNLGTGPVISIEKDAYLYTWSQILLDGVNGGDGISVKRGGQMVLTALTQHATVEVTGSVAGQFFSIGPRNIDATMEDDFNIPGDFVSGARAFWDAGLTVTADVVTLTTRGAVIAAEATTATSAGPKLLQNSATPGAGAVQVTYANGYATLTFNAVDAVTVADVYVQPEDDGTRVRT